MIFSGKAPVNQFTEVEMAMAELDMDMDAGDDGGDDGPDDIGGGDDP